MSKLLKSRDCLMKCLGFVLLLGIISLGAIGGCGNNDGDGTQALTENDFANDATIFARLDGLILNFLEHPGSEETDNDTGETGNDVIPVTYQRTVQHTFCWEDDNEEAEHFMELADSEGTLILRLDVNGDCVTETIEAPLIPMDEVMVWFEDTETGTMFSDAPPNAFIGDLTESDMLIVLFSNGEWSVQMM